MPLEARMGCSHCDGLLVTPVSTPQQQGRRVTDGEHGHVDADLLHPVEEEDHAEEEQQVVVAGDHVLGAQVDERQEDHAGGLLDVALVAVGDAVGERLGEQAVRQEHEQGQRRQEA